ncbi:MAG: hypothetical protein ACRDNF_14805 [Streptosporangiaceae bacterium]
MTTAASALHGGDVRSAHNRSLGRTRGFLLPVVPGRRDRSVPSLSSGDFGVRVSACIRILIRLPWQDQGVTPEQFAAGLKVAAFDAAVRGTMKHLEQGLPGRGPHPRGQALTRWYSNLAADDRQMVFESVRDAAHAAVFHLLCVLDGVAIVDDPPHERLELTATDERGNVTVLAAADNPAELHGEFNALVHPPTEPWLASQEGE